MASKNPHREVGGRLEVTFVDKIGEIAGIQATNRINELNWVFKKNKIMFK